MDNVRIPVKRFVLVTIMLLSGLVSLPRLVNIEGISLLALLTVAYALLPWTLWLIRPVLTRSILGAIWPFIAFVAWASVSMFWYEITLSGLQNILVVLAFVGLVLLAASVSYYSYGFLQGAGRALALACHIAAGLYGASVLWIGLSSESMLNGLGSNSIISPRVFALFATLGVAWHLANWRYGSRKDSWWAIGLVLVIGASLSRLGGAIALLLFPLSQLSLRNAWGWVRGSLLAAVVTGSMIAVLMYVEPVRDRFLEGDLEQVGGIEINVEGRDYYWQSTWDSYLESPWIGHGGGSAEGLISRLTAGSITHPHNDYLRILHDYGLVGLSIWLLGFAGLLRATGKAWTVAERRKDLNATLYLTAFLALIVVALAMVTDNVMVYIVVMAPLGILVGAALGRKPG